MIVLALAAIGAVALAAVLGFLAGLAVEKATGSEAAAGATLCGVFILAVVSSIVLI